MIGFSGLLLTSATGAKIQWKPIARASRAVACPSRRDALTSPASTVGHQVWKLCRPGDAHRCAALEIAAHDQRSPRDALHAIDKGSGLIGLGVLHDAICRAVQQDQSADSRIPHQV